MTEKRKIAYSVSMTVFLLVSSPTFAQQGQTNAPAANALPPAAPPNAVVGPVPHSNSVTALPHEGSVSLSSVDQAFLEKAAHGGIAEVQLAQLAQQKSQSDQVKQFAQKMIDDHTENNQQLVKLADSKNVTPPMEPDAVQQKMERGLEAVSGQTFDRTYITGQIRAHEAMLKLFRGEAAHGRDPDLRAFAAQTVPVIREHLSLAEELRKAGV
jgi:putative membrane protein